MQDNLFVHILKSNFAVEISENPDVLFFSCYGFEHLKYKCHKVFFTGENVRPDFKLCDLSLSFDWEECGGKNIRLPLFRFNGDLEKLAENTPSSDTELADKKFCCMLVSNPGCKIRNDFFERLSAYKQVDSGGGYKNNVGYRVQDRMSFLKEYKFVLSFENSCHPGYTTEKVLGAIFAASIPVYWGNPLINRDFNKDRIVNVHSYALFDDAIELIKKLDQDDELYMSYSQRPVFPNNRFPEHLTWAAIEHKVVEGIEKTLSKKPVAKTTVFYPSYNKLKKQIVSRITKRPHWYC